MLFSLHLQKLDHKIEEKSEEKIDFILKL